MWNELRGTIEGDFCSGFIDFDIIIVNIVTTHSCGILVVTLYDSIKKLSN